MDYKTLFELCWGSSLQSKLKCPRLLNYFIMSIGTYVGCVELQYWHYLTDNTNDGFGVQYSASWLINYIRRKTSRIVIKNYTHKRSLTRSIQTILLGGAKQGIGKTARLIICAIFYKFAEVKGLIPNQEQEDLTLLPLVLQIGALFVHTHPADWKPELVVPIKLKSYYKTITNSYSVNLDKEFLKSLRLMSPKSFNNKDSILSVVGKKRCYECCAVQEAEADINSRNKRRKIQHDDDDVNNNETTIIDTTSSLSSFTFSPTTSTSTISSGRFEDSTTTTEFEGILSKANDLIIQAYSYYKGDGELDSNDDKNPAMASMWNQMKILFERNIHAEDTANHNNSELECKQEEINYEDLKYSFDNFVPDEEDEEEETFIAKPEPEILIDIKNTTDINDTKDLVEFKFKSIQTMIDSTFNIFQHDDDDKNSNNIMDFEQKPTEQKLQLALDQNAPATTATMMIPHEFQELIYIFD